MAEKIVASKLLHEAVTRYEIHLSLLVSYTGLWVSPEFHRRLLEDTGSVAMFPMVRRARAAQGERRGAIVNGVRLDDNSYANQAMKRACGLGRSAEGFETCHIWALTCYDERYHTAPANMVLLPRALAALSDHDSEIRKALQFRAYELYEWWPEGELQPVKPEYYPAAWRPPQPDVVPKSVRARSENVAGGSKTSNEMQRVLSDRIREWSKKPHLNVHKIIALVLDSNSRVSRMALVDRIGEVTRSKNPYGAVASLLTDGGNAYGRVLIEEDGLISIHPSVSSLVEQLTWSSAANSQFHATSEASA